MGIRFKPSLNLTARDRIAIKKGDYAQSTLFCYLLLKSRYVPRILAWWGLVASFVALVSTLVIIVFPGADGIAPGCYAPVGIFEIVTGFWLLIAGIRVPQIATASPAPL